MPDQVPKEVVQESYERLVTLVEDVAWTENTALLGRDVEAYRSREEFEFKIEKDGGVRIRID